MKKILVSISLFAALGASLSAGDGAGSVAMPFAEIPRNAAALGEGGVHLVGSSSSLAYGAFENIAALPFTTSKVDVGGGYEMWAPKQSNEKFINFGAGVHFGKFAASVAGSLGNNEPYTEYREGGFEGSKFTPKDMHIAFGAAYGITKNIGLGVSGKYLSNTLSSAAAYSAFGVDVMAFGSFGPVNVGAGVRNIGSKVKSYSGDEFSIPTAASVGVAYASAFGLGAELDADYVFAAGPDISAGAHYCWNDMLTVRAGYHVGAVLPSFLSLGLGAKFFGVYVDAAYLVSPAVPSGTLCISAGYRF